MNPNSVNGSPAVAANSQSEIQNPRSDRKPGRPRALTKAKRSEFLARIADGLGLEYAAKHVGCSMRTIRREMERDPNFAFSVEYAEKAAPMNPLQALQDFARENWRAAAWLLERLFPERFGRRPRTTAFGKRQARQLLNEVLKIVDAEVIDMPQRNCINCRIRATFEYFTHVYCAHNRSPADLRRAVELFEKNAAQHDLEWLFTNGNAPSSPISDPAPGKVPSPENDATPKRPSPAPSPRRGGLGRGVSPLQPRTISEASRI